MLLEDAIYDKPRGDQRSACEYLASRQCKSSITRHLLYHDLANRSADCMTMGSAASIAMDEGNSKHGEAGPMAKVPQIGQRGYGAKGWGKHATRRGGRTRRPSIITTHPRCQAAAKRFPRLWSYSPSPQHTEQVLTVRTWKNVVEYIRGILCNV